MMIFTVSSELGSNLVLQSLSNTLRAGGVVAIEGEDLNAPDVTTAIENGYLIPENKEEYEKANLSIEEDKLTITNKTGNLLILGKMMMNADSVIIVKRAEVDMKRIVMAYNDGQIDVQKYDNEPLLKKKIVKEKKIKESKEEQAIVVGQQEGDPEFTPEQKQKLREDLEKILSDAEVEAEVTVEEQEEPAEKKYLKKEAIKHEEEMQKTTPQTWDFRQESLVEAEKVETAIEPKFVDNKKAEEKRVKDKIDFIETKKAQNTNKNSVKKENIKKTKKVEKEEPIDKAEAPKDNNILDVELKNDSNELDNVADDLIREENLDDIVFADDQQNKENLENRYGASE